jgi:PAS domain S-box-containing protein
VSLRQLRQLLLLGIGFAVVIAISAVSVWLINRIEDDAGRVAQTLEVEKHLWELRFALRRSESGERGFLLTDDPGYLDTYRAGIAAAPREVDELRRMTADNPVQQRGLDELAPLVNERLAQMAEVIGRYQSGDREGALAIVRGTRGRSLAEDIGGRIGRMQAEEERLLQSRSADFRQTSRDLLVAMLAGALLIAVLAILSNFLVRRSNAALRATQRALEEANAGLEVTVAERTADLGGSQALKGAILESALDCIVTVTDESRIVEWNPAAERTFGHSRSEAIGADLAELVIPPEYRDRHREGLSRYLATGVGPVLGKRIELEALRGDGARFPVEVAINPIRIGAKTYFTAYLRDITQRKRAEDALRDSNEEIQRFAYIVSHDLRSPLVNIMGFTSEIESLREGLSGRLAELHRLAPDDAGRRRDQELVSDLDEAIGFIKASIAKMDRLIAAILRLSREGRRDFSLQPIDMDQLLAGIAASLAHQAETAGATLTFEALPALTSDRLAVEQIFSNLIDNALKYLRPDVPGRIEVKGRVLGPHAIYEVRDNGRGIESNDRERVFELFRRAGAQDRPGEGIGLAHVRALVRRLGGRIHLESQPGAGSTFTVVLPRSLAAAPEQKAA